MNKAIKVISLILAIVLILSVFAGCGKSETNNTTTESSDISVTEQDNNQDSAGSELQNNNSSKNAVSVVKKFVESVIKRDYKTAHSCFGDKEEYPFFTPEAIETVIKSADLEKLLELNFDDLIEYENSNYDVIVVCKDKNIRVKIHTDDVNGKCVIPVLNYVYSSYKVTLPGGEMKCYLNGVEITEKYFKEYYGNDLKLRKTYELPKVPIGIVTFKFVSSTFGEKTVQFDTKNHYDAVVQVDVHPDAYTAIEKIYNETAQCVSNDTTEGISEDEIAEILPYISQNISVEAREAIARTIIADWNNEFLVHGGSKETNLKGYDFKQCLDSQYRSFYLTDKIISLTFDYSASYDTYWTADGHVTPRQFNYATTIYLEQTDDGYVIYNLMNTDLFTLNYMRNRTL